MERRTQEPIADLPADPVSDPDAYRAYLLGALGDDDPAAVQADARTRTRELVNTAGDRLSLPPSPGEWSAIECLGHLVDSEVVLAARVRWILAEDRPDIVGYDQDRWVAGLRHRADDPRALLALFDALRASNLELWARSTPEERLRVGVHRERGEESYELLFHLAAGHDRIHLAQANHAVAAASRSG